MRAAIIITPIPTTTTTMVSRERSLGLKVGEWMGVSIGRDQFAWLAPYELDLQASALHGGRFLHGIYYYPADSS